LEKHLQRLRITLSAEEQATDAPTTPSDDPDFALPEVLVEQQSHLKQFVGREPVLTDLKDWIDREVGGGYLLLLGPPGQGKSALMAELAQREAGRGGCLLHMVKSHRQPRRFVPALISQAARLARFRFGAERYAGDLEDLRNALVQALEVVRDDVGRAVVVLDGLDELEDVAGRIDFLPAALPEGVRVLLSCRPDIPLTEALRARLRGCLQERILDALEESDFRLLLEKRLEASAVHALEQTLNVAEVFRRLGGNPLFLHCFTDDIAERWTRAGEKGVLPPVDLDALPVTLDAVFRDIYGRIRSNRGRQQARLLQFMCVAREALTLEHLAGLMTAEGEALPLEDCRDQVESLSQWLLEAGRGRFKPWHQGLADYVRGQVLGAAGVAEIEGAFCRWLALPEAGKSLYGLKYRPSHLLAAGPGFVGQSPGTTLPVIGNDGRDFLLVLPSPAGIVQAHLP
jgi:hypothetical protein